jgi:uncharacterized protein
MRQDPGHYSGPGLSCGCSVGRCFARLGGGVLPAYVGWMKLDPKTQTELEAATFRRLLEHLRERTDVQNIDLMNLAGFCRNCLSNWYEDAAKASGVAITREDARAMVYGMPYDEWKAKHQPGDKQAHKASH